MSQVTTRAALKAYCLRTLGSPSITIDVTDDQIEDSIEESISFFQEYYWDGVEREYLRHQLTAQNIIDQYILIPDYIYSVTAIFPASTSSNRQTNIFDMQYQIRMNDLRDITSTSMVYYAQVMQHISMLESMLQTQPQIRFNRLNQKLYIDASWTTKIVEGDWIIIDAYAALDPATSPKMYNERLFKAYVTAQIKSRWGAVLKKYSNITLPGGTTLDGQSMYSEAQQEISDIENTIMNALSPLMFSVG